MDRAEVIEQLKQSKKVTYFSAFRDGRRGYLLHTKDERLAASLQDRGAAVRWHDRTEWSTKAGKSKASMQAEIEIGPRFMPEKTP